MENSDECMRNDAMLMTRGGGSCASNATLGSDQVQGGKGHELNMKWQR